MEPGSPKRLLHGTAIALPNGAALIRGESGRGKSDLALRCLLYGPSPLLPDPATLVSDDQVAVVRRGDAVFVSAPEAIKGKLEVRGLGVIDIPCASAEAPLLLVVDLTPQSEIERLPDGGDDALIEGVRLPSLKVDARSPGAAGKVLLALRNVRLRHR